MISDGTTRWGRGKTVAALILIAVLAGGVRFGYQDGFSKSPFSGTPLGESASNVNLADMISTTGALGEEPYSRPPLYPLLLSLLSRSHDEIQPARGTQAVAGVIIACLVFLGGSVLLGTAGGLIAGVFCALYGPLIYWESQFVPAALLTFLFTCYWLLCVGASRRRLLPLWLAAGLLVGAMAGLRTGAFVLLVPAVLLVITKLRSLGRARAFAALLLLLLGTAIAAAPFVAHNWKAGEAAMGIAANGGTELYIANNPSATGLAPGLAGESTWWHGERYAEMEAIVESGRALSESEVSRYWARQAAGYIVRNPISYLRLLGRKLGLFWSRHEIDAGPSPVFVSKNWIPWSASIMRAFALLGPLALAGLFLFRKRGDALLLAFTLLGAMVMALVYTSPSTVRLLALPSIALLSSATLLELFLSVRGRRIKRAASILAATAVCAVAVNLAAPKISGAQTSEANDQRLLGVVYETQGKGSLALSQYDRAKAMAPRSAACRLSLGAMLASDGVADDAERQFLTAAALDSLSPTPHLGLANLYRRNGLLEQSLLSLKAALHRAPYDIGLVISLGRSCVEMGLYEQAEMYFRSALQVDPENISAIDGLLELRDRGVLLSVKEEATGSPDTVKGKIERAMALLRQGDMEGSRQLLDEAMESTPDDLDVVFADATWHLAAGNPEKSIEGYERCHNHNPKNTVVMNNLAAAYQQIGRTDEAVALLRRILKLDPSNAKAKSNLRKIESESSGAPAE